MHRQPDLEVKALPHAWERIADAISYSVETARYGMKQHVASDNGELEVILQ